VPNQPATKKFGGTGLKSSTHCVSRQEMEVSGELHASVALSAGKRLLYPVKMCGIRGHRDVEEKGCSDDSD